MGISTRVFYKLKLKISIKAIDIFAYLRIMLRKTDK
jgi:hypothetical protein